VADGVAAGLLTRPRTATARPVPAAVRRRKRYSAEHQSRGPGRPHRHALRRVLFTASRVRRLTRRESAPVTAAAARSAGRGTPAPAGTAAGHAEPSRPATVS
jgi:hypothetical protein